MSVALFRIPVVSLDGSTPLPDKVTITREGSNVFLVQPATPAAPFAALGLFSPTTLIKLARGSGNVADARTTELDGFTVQRVSAAVFDDISPDLVIGVVSRSLTSAAVGLLIASEVTVTGLAAVRSVVPSPRWWTSGELQAVRMIEAAPVPSNNWVVEIEIQAMPELACCLPDPPPPSLVPPP